MLPSLINPQHFYIILLGHFFLLSWIQKQMPVAHGTSLVFLSHPKDQHSIIFTVPNLLIAMSTTKIFEPPNTSDNNAYIDCNCKGGMSKINIYSNFQKVLTNLRMWYKLKTVNV